MQHVATKVHSTYLGEEKWPGSAQGVEYTNL